MHEQLMISDRMASVGILAAGVAHEINNPLAAVISNLDMALEDLDAPNPDVESIRESLSDARTASDRVKNIVRDLRIFSRSEDETTGAVAVDKVLESTLRMAANELRHRASVVKKFEAIPPVAASEARLGQVFLNLVVNAAQAMPEGHARENELRLSISVDGNRARIDIADTGPGIPPEVMKRLFTPFVTTKPKGVGTGLGLSICHRIVTSFGGELTATTSTAGTTFTVLLPLWAGSQPASVTSPIPVVTTVKRGKVLVVDDDAVVAKSVTRTLASHHDTVTADSGRRALDLLRGGARFDVILCDVMMPEMTGPELYDEVLRLAPEQARAMVFVTGGVFTSSAQEFLERVSNPRIEKPFDIPSLRSLINDCMR
jgi:CheY-like chemotaxis protein